MPNDKCIVYGCTNHKDEGEFIGDICMPCYIIITTGKVGPTDNFIGVFYRALQRIIFELTPEKFEPRP